MAVAGAQELEPEPNLWTKLEPELKINNFGSATLIFYMDPDPILHFEGSGSGSGVRIGKFLGDKQKIIGTYILVSVVEIR